jgi:lipopolysaccharide/colanic/teichoic acid biosynthesis glycosyltransferase
MMKRSFDLVVSVCGLITAAPVMLIVALLLLCTRDGPVLFRQTRVGRHGVSFTLYKFRTMRAASAKIDRQVTVGADARITPLGGILRKSKVDELPQLWNVLRGEMSLVGPRPETPEFVALYPTQLRDIILSVRPGITDAASIKYRNESDLLALVPDPIAHYEAVIMPDKLHIAASYVQNHSFWGDLCIIARTVLVVVRPGTMPTLLHIRKQS